MSSLALSRETHPAADLGLISSLVEDRTPLIAEGAQFVPFDNQFAKSDMGFFYLEIYDPDPASVGVEYTSVGSQDRGAQMGLGSHENSAFEQWNKSWDSGGSKLADQFARKRILCAGNNGVRFRRQASQTDGFEVK